LICFFIIFAISAGFVIHNLNFNRSPSLPDQSQSDSPISTSAATLTTVDTNTPVFETPVPYTHTISFSKDTTLPLLGKVILLDPGHGGKDSGCIYTSGNQKYSESAINLTIAAKTKTALEAKGATVIMLRTDDSWISLYNRISLAHLICIQYADQMNINILSNNDEARLISELSASVEINSDTISSGGMGIMAGTGVGSEQDLLMNLEKNLTNVLYLSIHTNSNPYSSLHGAQVYFVTDESVISDEINMVKTDSQYRNNPDFPIRDGYYGRNGTRNQLLAQSLYDAIAGSAPQMKTNAEPVLSSNYAVLREHNLTGALIEVGYITNKMDRSFLTDNISIAQISSGIAEGCVNFFA
jgi:N-acetylmuramoyl-L-alanine amidase